MPPWDLLHSQLEVETPAVYKKEPLFFLCIQSSLISFQFRMILFSVVILGPAVLFQLIFLTEGAAILTWVPNDEGQEVICPGKHVHFVCYVITAGILQWAVQPYHSVGTTPLHFSISRNDIGDILSDGIFTSTLTDRNPDPNYGFLGNLTAELHFIATLDLDQKSVYCSDGFLIMNDAPRYILHLAGHPSHPRNLTYSIVSYGIAEYSVRVQWQTPSDGGMGISNYTLTLTSQEETLASVSSEGDLARSERTVSNPKILFLNYTTNYSVVVTANNCVGNSSSSILVLSQAGCSSPSVPVNGSIEEYRSTEEGAQIKFHCDEGYTPSQCNTSQCTNTTWSPDPQSLNCTFYLPVTTDAGICETPSLPNNGSLEYTATGVGAVLKIVCNSGFKTSDTASSLTVAVCSEDGWTPDPSTIHCVQLQQTGYSVTVKNPGIILGLSATGTFCIFFLLGVAVGVCLVKTAR